MSEGEDSAEVAADINAGFNGSYATPFLGGSRAGDVPARWTPLHAIAWIATRDIDWVRGVSIGLRGALAPRCATAETTRSRLAIDLADKKAEEDGGLNFDECLLHLVRGIVGGDIVMMSGKSAMVLTAAQALELRCIGSGAGFAIVGSPDDAPLFSLNGDNVTARWPPLNAPRIAPSPVPVSAPFSGAALKKWADLEAAEDDPVPVRSINPRHIAESWERRKIGGAMPSQHQAREAFRLAMTKAGKEIRKGRPSKDHG
jgi:hypothetical protein